MTNRQHPRLRDSHSEPNVRFGHALAQVGIQTGQVRLLVHDGRRFPERDGVLHLELPLGAEAAGQEWKVTIERVPRTMSREEWADWLDKTAGCITDPSFVRHPQCEHEVRDTV